MALDATVNTPETEVVTFITRDNKYIFIGRGTDIYWMDASNILTGIDTHHEISSGAILNQNFPNPFLGRTTIGYSLPEPSFVTIDIYDMMNKKIATLVNEDRLAGNHVISFDAANLPGGIYVCLLRVDDTSLIRKMGLVK
jgi:hypothetical protein